MAVSDTVAAALHKQMGFGCQHQEIPISAPYLGNELLERLFASDAGSVLALLRAGLQSSRVTSSKDGHDLNMPLVQAHPALSGSVDSTEC